MANPLTYGETTPHRKEGSINTISLWLTAAGLIRDYESLRRQNAATNEPQSGYPFRPFLINIPMPKQHPSRSQSPAALTTERQLYSGK